MRNCLSSLIAIISLISGMSANADPIDKMEGAYTHIVGTDTKIRLVLLKLTPATAYFELKPAYAVISGIAEVQSDGSLLYQEDASEEAGQNHWCKLGIHVEGERITISDPVDSEDAKDPLAYGTCTILHGSSKAGFGGHKFKRSTRRSLTATDIENVVRSEGFQKALIRRELYIQEKVFKPN